MKNTAEKMSNFRIKSEKEFIKEFGKKFKMSNNLLWRSDMDYLFGRPITMEEYLELKLKGCVKKQWSGGVNNFNSFWFIYPNMITTVNKEWDIIESYIKEVVELYKEANHWLPLASASSNIGILEIACYNMQYIHIRNALSVLLNKNRTKQNALKMSKKHLQSYKKTDYYKWICSFKKDK